MRIGPEKKNYQKARSAAGLLLAAMVATLACSSLALAQGRQPNEIEKLRQLYDRKRYFELRDAVDSSRGQADASLLFFRGVVANVFNRPRASIAYLRQYLARAGDDGAQLSDAYTTLADDFIKLSDYDKAADAYRTILDRFKQRLTPDEIEDYENSTAIYDALRHVPRQRVIVRRAARLNEPSREAGWSVTVEADQQRVALGLDTGANISLLAKSVAARLGVKMLGRSILMGSITSIRVRPELGYLPVMKIGGVTIYNAVFIVMDDQALTFPDGFVLKGVIGFPVIADLGEISFKSDGTVAVSRPHARAGRPNMCLDGRDILLRGEYEQRELVFTLDTGAERSILYLPFLHDFEGEVKTKYSLRPEKFTGVGGTEEVPAYLVKDFEIGFDGKRARLPEIRLLTKALTEKGKFYYGNIGDDLIKRFRRMTLDFGSMRIAFE